MRAHSGRFLLIPFLSLGSLIVACGAPAGGGDAGAPDAGEVDAGEVDAGCPSVEETSTRVNTREGPVEGEAGEGVRSWKAIPYAAPPVGALRWKPPVPATCRAETLAATSFGPACAQLTAEEPRAVEGSEDCLTLNIWSPESASRASTRPVMVWVHGGGNSQGSAREQLAGGEFTYDGADLARDQDVVVVTVQYRLGPFGYLSNAALLAESVDGSSGNYGLRDLLAGLAWVRDNIAGFGGDASRVTLFGESAGGVNTCALTSSPLSAGLFHRAIIQSGGCATGSRTLLEREQEPFAANLGCSAGDVLACLRAKGTEEVLRALPETVSVAGGAKNYWEPHVDGVVLPKSADAAIGAGDGLDIPVLIGANARETSRTVAAVPTCEAYEAAVQAQFGFRTSRILLQYPCEAYDTPRLALEAVTGDARFVCGARRNARAFVKGKTTPTWRYLFAKGLERGPAAGFGAFHGLDVLYVFGSGMDSLVATNADRTLSDAMQRYWGRFAHAGSPNDALGADPAWPSIAEEDERALVLDTTIEARADTNTLACDFWDTLIE